MISTIICSLVITHYMFTYLKYINEFNFKDAKTIVNVVHSSIISLACFLYINELITLNTMMIHFNTIIGFFIFDIYYILHYNIKNELLIKSIHHSLSIVGIIAILYDNTNSIITVKLYLTEIINLPAEVRFVCVRYNYNKYNIKNISLFIIYLLFLFSRILYPINDLVFVYYNKPLFFSICFMGIYVVWCYWFFIVINYKLYKKLKSYYQTNYILK